MSTDHQKLQAALAALEYVRPGMVLGLGTGSTAAHFVDALGALVADGLKIICVPTSQATCNQALALNIPLTTLDETPEIDLTIDGADELDGHLRLIKGGGGALLREKIVAAASKEMIVIADAGKRVETLGAFPLPVEVIEFGAGATLTAMQAAAAGTGCEGRVSLRTNVGDSPFKTDNGNLIYDCDFGAIPDPEALGLAFNALPGVVEHGLFIRLCDLALIGTDDDIIRLKA
jgi:ribose 5-phosphate isomerase A